MAIEPEELETHHLFKAWSDRSETHANGTPEGRISDGPRGAAFDVFANVFPGRVTKTERVRPNASRNGLASILREAPHRREARPGPLVRSLDIFTGKRSTAAFASCCWRYTQRTYRLWATAVPQNDYKRRWTVHRQHLLAESRALLDKTSSPVVRNSGLGSIASPEPSMCLQNLPVRTQKHEP